MIFMVKSSEIPMSVGEMPMFLIAFPVLGPETMELLDFSVALGRWGHQQHMEVLGASNHTVDGRNPVVYPTNDRVSTIQGGAEFLPCSTQGFFGGCFSGLNHRKKSIPHPKMC